MRMILNPFDLFLQSINSVKNNKINVMNCLQLELETSDYNREKLQAMGIAV